MEIFGLKIERKKGDVKAFVQPPKERGGKFKYILEPSRLSTANVSRWRDAVNRARSQNWQDRTDLYDLYQDAIDIDTHLRALIEKRLLATVGRKLQYTLNDKPVESVDLIIESPQFEEMRRTYLYRKVFWENGLLHLTTEIDDNKTRWLKFTEYPPKHVDPFKKVIRQRQTGASHEDTFYGNAKNCIQIGEPDDLGLMLQLSLLAGIRKREAMNDWNDYSALAGRNFTHVLKKGTQDVKKIEDMQAYLAGATTAAYDPDQVDVKFENQSSSSQNQLFKELVEYLDAQMSILILGQTMTTTDGSSRSQAEVHERTQETILDHDAQEELHFLNYHFTDWATNPIIGLGIPKGGKWTHVQSSTLKKMEQLEFDLKIKDLGFMFSQEYIKQTYEINQKDDVNIETE